MTDQTPHTNGTNGVNSTNGTNGHSTQPALCHSAAEFLSHTYDFIVIGGGTAGLVLAARLTEDPNTVVGVLEAGKNRIDDPLVDTSAAFTRMLGNPEYDYGFKTVPQEGNRGTIHHISRGKMLGGSSGINYMMYVRGSDADYDDWASLVNDPSWSADALKPYMRKHETLEPIDKSILDRTSYPFVGQHHGTSGPVHTSFNDSSFPIEGLSIKAMDEVSGYSKKPIDPWSGDHIGFYSTLGTVTRSGPNKGKRSYAARGYLQANASRPNLKVLCEAQVNKIVLEETTATGVEFTCDGNVEIVKVKNEVVLCGGVFNSPQILELSGIGDPEVLEAAGVECKVKLPCVGENLQDHVLIADTVDLAPGNVSMDLLGDPATMEHVSKVLADTQSGPLTAIASTQGFFSYKSQSDQEELKKTVEEIKKTQHDPKTSPFHKKQLDQVIARLENEKSANMQIVMIPAGVDTYGIPTQKIWPPPDNSRSHRMALACCLQYPASRGYCHITTSDPGVHPKLDPAYMVHEADVAVLSKGMHFLHKLTQTPQLAPVIEKRTHPAPSIDLDDEFQRIEATKDWCMGEYHPCGTCALGEVVDNRLRVKGVKGLRVIDASIFPNHVSGNIVSSVYMVAERGADIIKEDCGFAVLEKLKELKV